MKRKETNQRESVSERSEALLEHSSPLLMVDTGEDGDEEGTSIMEDVVTASVPTDT